jgi:hypothetical protein
VNDKDKNMERLKQTRLEKIGTNDPVCAICTRNEWPIFEDHHVGGCKYCELTVVHCKNCHAIASIMALNHPRPIPGPPTTEEAIGRLLLGLADFFEQLIKTLRTFGEYLIELARTNQDGPTGKAA